MNLPNDPVMLLSFLNTRLRDQYGSLDELAADCMVDKAELVKKMQMINYEYDPVRNQFV